jgi:hypothetical protein
LICEEIRTITDAEAMVRVKNSRALRENHARTSVLFTKTIAMTVALRDRDCSLPNFRWNPALGFD